MKKNTVLLIDNYDSFTYNLVQYLSQLGARVIVRRNDEITVEEAQDINPDFVVYSPGPGTVTEPRDVGVGPQLLQHFKGIIPQLGVCLGQQMMGYEHGGTIARVAPMHGKRSMINVDNTSVLFAGLDPKVEVMRYHSLVVAADSISANFTVTGTTDDGLVMAFEDVKNQMYGVQFHPESIGTKTGMTMLENFLTAGAEYTLRRAEANSEGVADYLTKLHKKGETPADVIAFVRALRRRMTTVKPPAGPVFDVCGTGGTGKKRINVSTALTEVLAKKYTISKHGNRGATGRVGSMDIVEHLGLGLCKTDAEAQKSFQKHHRAYLFAPAFHGCLKPLGPIRKALGHPTVFNFVGPLLNPVPLTAQLTGVSSPAVGDVLAEVSAVLGLEIMLVHDTEWGLDECSIGGETQFWKVQKGIITTGTFTPADYDVEPVDSFEEIAGTGTVAGNADLVQQMTNGTAPAAYMQYLHINQRVAQTFFDTYT